MKQLLIEIINDTEEKEIKIILISKEIPITKDEIHLKENYLVIKQGNKEAYYLYSSILGVETINKTKGIGVITGA